MRMHVFRYVHCGTHPWPPLSSCQSSRSPPAAVHLAIRHVNELSSMVRERTRMDSSQALGAEPRIAWKLRGDLAPSCESPRASKATLQGMGASCTARRFALTIAGGNGCGVAARSVPQAAATIASIRRQTARADCSVDGCFDSSLEILDASRIPTSPSRNDRHV